MTMLSTEQISAIAVARDAVLERYHRRKAPPTAQLETEINAEIGRYIHRREQLDGIAIAPIVVRVTHTGGGYFEITPVVLEHVHTITVVV